MSSALNTRATYGGKINNFYSGKFIVSGGSIITKEKFGEILSEIFLHSDLLNEIDLQITLLENYLVTYGTLPKRNKKNNLEGIQKIQNTSQKIFNLLGIQNLGGNISLVTSFNNMPNTMGKTYFLGKESELISSVSKDFGINLVNTSKKLSKLTTAYKFNKTYEGHYQNFQNYLNERTGDTILSKSQRSNLYKWTYYNMPSRVYESYGPPKIKRSIRLQTFAEYFYGDESNLLGKAREAYDLHMQIVHSGDENNIFPGTDVIPGEFAPSSSDLWNLLNSAKGNDYALYGGDNIVMDSNFNIIYNNQVKSSSTNSYNILVRYQKLIEDLIALVNALKNSLNLNKNTKMLKQSIINEFYDRFATEVWINLEEVPRDILKEYMGKRTKILSSSQWLKIKASYEERKKVQ